MQLAIDVGHGYVKALSSRGHRALFPALLHPAPQVMNLGSYAQLPVTVIDGQSFVVGEPARRFAAPVWARNKAMDDDTLRLMVTAAAQCGATGPVTLATGLPLAWWGSQHQAFKTALLGFGATVRLPDAAPQRLWFESVLVLPQGIAAAGPVLDAAHYRPGPYLVVDIGYRTTDFLLVTKQADGVLAFDPLAAGSIELGMHAVYAGLAESLTTTYQIPFTAAQVAEVSTVVVRGESVEIATVRAAQATLVAQSLVKALLEKLDAQMDQVLGLVAVGGGSRLLSDALPQVIQPPDPQWANAQGYLAAVMAADRLRVRSAGVQG